MGVSTSLKTPIAGRRCRALPELRIEDSDGAGREIPCGSGQLF